MSADLKRDTAEAFRLAAEVPSLRAIAEAATALRDEIAPTLSRVHDDAMHRLSRALDRAALAKRDGETR